MNETSNSSKCIKLKWGTLYENVYFSWSEAASFYCVFELLKAIVLAILNTLKESILIEWFSFKH